MSNRPRRRSFANEVFFWPLTDPSSVASSDLDFCVGLIVGVVWAAKLTF